MFSTVGQKKGLNQDTLIYIYLKRKNSCSAKQSMEMFMHRLADYGKCFISSD